MKVLSLLPTLRQQQQPPTCVAHYGVSPSHVDTSFQHDWETQCLGPCLRDSGWNFQINLCPAKQALQQDLCLAAAPPPPLSTTSGLETPRVQHSSMLLGFETQDGQQHPFSPIFVSLNECRAQPTATTCLCGHQQFPTPVAVQEARWS